MEVTHPRPQVENDNALTETDPNKIQILGEIFKVGVQYGIVLLRLWPVG